MIGVTDLPCADNPDAFTTPYPNPALVDRLAADNCDACPVRAACYRDALGDPSAWGLFGGVWFADGNPVQARHVRWYSDRKEAA